MAGRLAAEGFFACLPDLFHRFDGIGDALASGDGRGDISDDEALDDLDATLAYLREQSYVIDDEIGIVGVCQTGRQPLLDAGHRNDAAAIVVMYGGVGARDWEESDSRPTSVAEFIKGVSCLVLGLFGEEDHVVAVEEVARFRTELEAARKSYRIRIYRGAPHGWLNDTMPGRYRPGAAEAAWSELTAFLDETLTTGWDPEHVRWCYESDITLGYDFSKNRRLA